MSDQATHGISETLLVVGAIVIVFSIKLCLVYKKHEDQKQRYIDPNLLIPEMAKKLEKFKEADMRNLIAHNLENMPGSLNYVRNLAIILGYCSRMAIPIQHYLTPIRDKAALCHKQPINRAYKLYLEYIDSLLGNS